MTSTIDGLVLLGYRVEIPVPGGPPSISEVDIGLVAAGPDGDAIPAGRITINGPWPLALYDALDKVVVQIEQAVAMDSGFFTGAIPQDALNAEMENILTGPWTGAVPTDTSPELPPDKQAA